MTIHPENSPYFFNVTRGNKRIMHGNLCIKLMATIWIISGVTHRRNTALSDHILLWVGIVSGC